MDSKESKKVVKSNIENIYALGPLQEGMLFHYMEDSQTTSYIIQNVFDVMGLLQENLLLLALEMLAKKHEVLRTNIMYDKLKSPKQVLLKKKTIEFKNIDLKSYSEEEQNTLLEEIKQQDIQRGFLLQKDSLMRVKYIQIGEKKSQLLFSYHHIIIDGWSISTLYDDFFRYYNLLYDGTSQQELIQIMEKERSQKADYVDYIRWYGNKDKQEALKYWKDYLGDYNFVADIPGTNQEQLKNSVHTKSKRITLEQSYFSTLQKISKENNITLNSIFETAWGILLQRYCYTQDVVFGKVVSGRNSNIPGIEKTVGLFINSIPIRVKTEPNDAIIDLCKRVHKQALYSDEYEYCSLADIQSLTSQKGALVKNLFIFENYEKDESILMKELGGVPTKAVAAREQTNYPLNMIVLVEQDELSLELMYDSNQYLDLEITLILEHMKVLLEQITENVNSSVECIEIVTLQERQRILNQFNHTLDKSKLGEQDTIIDLFQRQAAQTPENIAITYEEQVLTYKEMHQKVMALASELRRQGVQVGDKVPLIAKRSIEMIVGIFGILAAGAAYVPIHVDYPKERVDYIFRDCEASIVVVYQAPIDTELRKVDLAESALYGNCENLSLDQKVTLEDMAYIIYTSGTSGRPKGVQVLHKNLLHYVNVFCNEFSIQENSVVLQQAYIGFDTSIEEIFPVLIHGGKVAILNHEHGMDEENLRECLNRNKVTLVSCSPLLISIMNQMEDIDTVTCFISGGDKLSYEYVNNLVKKGVVYNTYGPTEATVCATYYRVQEEDMVIPIGKPIANCQVYIMHENSLCGIGVPGELCITGMGVTAGYLNHPQLTEEKFIKNPFGDGKLYRTGDLAKWNADGNLIYLGRIDAQVKIRGFRIELLEIENALRKNKNIDDAVVVAGGPLGQQELLAYIKSEQKLNMEEIRQELRNQLPDYMIPYKMLQISEIPVNSSGKVNVSSLPKIEHAYTENFQKPEGEIEEMLAEAFQEVLGVEKVGSQENFFVMGGDSIKAIRVVSYVRNKGYELNVGTIMKKARITDIAKLVRTMEANERVFQEEVSGEVEETPILRSFKEWNLEKPEHFNQEVMFPVKEETVEEVGTILRVLTEHHDMLRAVYRGEKLYIRKIGEGREFDLEEVKYPDDEEDMKQKIVDTCNLVQKSMDLENGPLLKAVFFKGNRGNRVFLCAHHLIIDGVSWRILLEDYEHVSRQQKIGQKIQLPDKTASFQKWAKHLKEYRKSQDFYQDELYWRYLKTEVEGWEKKSRKRKIEGTRYQEYTITLSKQETEELKAGLAECYGVSIREGLLTALCMAIGKEESVHKVLLAMEGHGREELHKSLPIERTIGWFTTIYPVMLHIRKNVAEAILQVKEELKRIPKNGIGYGLLDWKLPQEPEIYFNYLGEMTEGKQEASFFGTGESSAKENGMQGIMNMNSWMEGGVLKVNFVWDACFESVLNYKEMTKDYKACIQEMIQLLTSQRQEGWEKIYPLSALQKGILFHYMKENTKQSYMIQSLLRLDENVEEDNCKDVLECLEREEEVLRTRIQYRGLQTPYQGIVADRKIEFHTKIMNEEETYEDICYNDYERGFDLEKDSLIRVQLLKKKGKPDYLLWSYHHIILDGWSMALVYAKFFGKMKEGRNIQKGLSYETYINWTLSQSVEAGIEYWRKYLDQYETGAGIPEDRVFRGSQKTQEGNQGIQTYRIKESEIKELKAWLAEEGITISTLVEVVWGIVLQWYNRTNDVVFGKVISGRDSDVSGIEQMVGLLINSIPVRIKNQEEMSICQLLHKVQEEGIEGNQYGTLSMAQIQGEAGTGNNLVQSLYVFENYFKEGSQNGYELLYEKEGTNYPVTIIAGLDNGDLILELMYESEKYSEERIQRILLQMKGIILQIKQNPFLPIRQLQMVTEEEKKSILGKFQCTASVGHERETILDIWNHQVEKHGIEKALIFREKSICYHELDEYGNCVAHELQNRGIKKGCLVPILASRSLELVIGILGIVKAGAAYVPVDLDYPRERIEYIIKDCSAEVVVTYGNTIPLGDKELALENMGCWNGNKEKVEIQLTPEDLAYVIYTSGTTGKPKGVMLRHRGVVAMKYFLENMYQVTSKDRVLQFANHVFDASVWEMTLALLNGAVLVLIHKEDILDTRRFREYVEQQGVTLALLPPEYYLQSGIKGLRILTTGGSAASKEVVRKAISENCRYVNAYGPTENTVLATHWEPTEEEVYTEKIPIGKPMWETSVYIMNQGKLCGIGIPGEICITGAGLAKGYLNEEALTREKFVENPYGAGKMYHTGDLGYWKEDGNIEYLGRMDEQIKIRGYRVELKEIESVIRESRFVKDVVVLALGKEQGDTKIHAYVVEKEKGSTEELRNNIREKLPWYMIPASIQVVKEIPVTKSGKVDHRELERLEKEVQEQKRGGKDENEAKKTEEKGIQKIWIELLGKSNIGIRENFFESGGHSLLITKLIVLLEQGGYGQFTVGEIFSNPTIEQQARMSREKTGKEVILKEILMKNVLIGERTNPKIRRCIETEKGLLYHKMKQEKEEELFYGLLFVYVYSLWQHSDENKLELCVGHKKGYRVIKVEMCEDIEECYKRVLQSYEQAEEYTRIHVKIHRKQGGLLPFYLYNFIGEREGIEKADIILETTIGEGLIIIGEGRKERISEELLKFFVRNYKEGIEMVWS